MLYKKSLTFVYSIMNSNNSIVAHIGQQKTNVTAPFRVLLHLGVFKTAESNCGLS